VTIEKVHLVLICKLLFAAYSHLLATVHMVLDRSLPQPLEGTMSATMWRMKRSCDASYHSATSRALSIKRKVLIVHFNCPTF